MAIFNAEIKVSPAVSPCSSCHGTGVKRVCETCGGKGFSVPQKLLE